RHGLRRVLAIDIIELDHRLPFMSVTFGTRLYAGLASDATGRVYEEFEFGGNGHRESRFLVIVAARVFRRTPAGYPPSASGPRRPCIQESSTLDPAPNSSTGWRSCAPPNGMG